MRAVRSVFLTALVLAAGASCAFPSHERAGNDSVEASLALFQLDPGLRISVFAAEPWVRDPVDLAFDERGDAYVAEMLDYPFDPEPGTAPRSRIRRLIDGDGDGTIDGAAVFADSIRQITGLQPWNRGLIVTAAPDILYLRDNDGDGRADERRILFTGFSLANPQHRVSSPRFALDNWIYVANDGQPGTIRAVEYAAVLAEAYPPGRGSSSPRATSEGTSSAAAPAESSGSAAADANLGASQIPESETPESGEPVSVLGADFRFRMDRPAYEPASGPAQYGHTFNARGHRFIMHNTVHVRHVVLPRHYLARNPYLAARRTAHEISDHGLEVFQQSPAEAWRISRTDIRSRRYEEESLRRTERLLGAFTGVSGGAIYAAEGLPTAYNGNLFVGEVAANAVHRDVLDPSGPTFVARRPQEDAEREFLTSTDPWFRPATLTVGPDGALYVVDMYREIIESPEYMPEPVRQRLDFYSGTELGRIYRIAAADARPFAPPVVRASAPISELVSRLDHPNQWFRLTAQRVLLERRDPRAIPLLRQVVQSGTTAEGRLHALYALEGLGGLERGLIADALYDASPGVREHALRLIESFSVTASHVVPLLSDPDARVRFQAVLTLGGVLSPEAVQALAAVATTQASDPWISTAILTIAPELHPQVLRHLVRDARFFDEVDPGERDLFEGIAAVVGARGEPEEIAWLQSRLADDLNRDPWRQAGLSGLESGLEMAGGPASQAEPGVWREAAAETVNPNLPIEQRRSASDRLSTHQSWTEWLLQKVAAGAVPPQALGLEARLHLFENPDATIRAEVAAVLPPDLWSGALADHAAVLERAGDPGNGRSIFYARCAVCHLGWNVVGPDLAGVSNKEQDQLLEAILVPDRAIPGTYASYVALLTDESIVSGRIVAESPGTVTFRGYRGDQTVLRSRVRAIRRSRRSMMPADAASGLTSQELADLIAFLRAEE